MIGAPLERVDGRAKVTGEARYAYEEPLADVAYGVIVTSTIATGRIASIDTTSAHVQRGVLAVLTHLNAPQVHEDAASPGDRKLRLLQDDRVLYDRQPVALVIAETFEAATDAANRVHVTYAADTPATTMASPPSRTASRTCWPVARCRSSM